MPKEPKNPQSKASQKAKETKREIRIIPKALTEIHFDDASAWLEAYRNYPAGQVMRAVFSAFRKRYFLSQKDAAERIGISETTFAKWERGMHNLRWCSRHQLIKNRWFKPQHFGLDANAAEFEMEAGHADA